MLIPPAMQPSTKNMIKNKGRQPTFLPIKIPISAPTMTQEENSSPQFIDFIKSSFPSML